jgi:hypothetical protein
MSKNFRYGAGLALVILISACANLGEKLEHFHWDLHPAQLEESSPEEAASEDAWVMVPSAEARRLLQGKWYGTLTEEGVRKEWLTERAADGTYRVDFLTTSADGEQSSQSEVGFWGTSGGVYFRIFRGWAMLDGMKTANPNNPSYYDAYQILTLDQHEMRYQHLEDERIYVARRVPADFRLPIKLRVSKPAPVPVTNPSPRLQF